MSAQSPANTIPIFGIPISKKSLSETLQSCRKRVRDRKGGYVCIANVHTVTESKSNPELREALRSAFFATPDGMPLVWASHLKRDPVSERVCGPDLMKSILEQERGNPFGFIGGNEEQAEQIAKKFEIEAVSHSPPHRAFSPERAREDWAAFLEKCPNGQAPPIVWVALGAPKQEYWMKVVSPIAPETLFFGIGAAIDFLSGSKKRAPVWMQKTGLEWSFRLLSEPRRLWKRYLTTNTKFLFYLAGDLFRKPNSPSIR